MLTSPSHSLSVLMILPWGIVGKVECQGATGEQKREQKAGSAGMSGDAAQGQLARQVVGLHAVERWQVIECNTLHIN